MVRWCGLLAAAAVLQMAGLTSAAAQGDGSLSHGYRAKRGDTQYIYIVPPGLDRGVCQPGATAATLGTMVPGLAESRNPEAPSDRPPSRPAAGGIGAEMNGADQLCVARALEFVPDRSPVGWRNTGSGTVYQVVPLQTFERRDGSYCREFLLRAAASERTHSTVETACRTIDGRWAPVR